MYNLHCHSLLSDGDLLPSEVAVRYAALGYKVIAITDHVDYSNIVAVTSGILKFTRSWPKNSPIKVLPGVELTHLPLKHFKPLARYARLKGIKVIIGHGESPVEPVTAGTNRAALEADIDILAHPGEISDADASLAAIRGIFLEITSRKGHGSTNSLVAHKALQFQAKLILNTDSHRPEDIIDCQQLQSVAVKSGLNYDQIKRIQLDTEKFLKRRGVK